MDFESMTRLAAALAYRIGGEIVVTDEQLNAGYTLHLRNADDDNGLVFAVTLDGE